MILLLLNIHKALKMNKLQEDKKVILSQEV